jgi:glucose/arabinose dehydrogenase/cytochrome c2
MGARLAAGLGAIALGLCVYAPTIGRSAPAPAGPVLEQRYWVEEVARGLNFGASIAWMPNGDALIAERQGALRILSKGKLDPQPITGVPETFKNSLNGIKDVILDPQFASNGLIYMLLSEGTYEAHDGAVYKARLQGHALTDVKRIFRSKDTEAGPGQITGRMILMKDGTLLVGIPDDNYHKRWARDLSSDIGKLIRINRDGTVPTDNPFVGKPGALPEIWTIGHRGILGLYQDPKTGAVYETEAGPKGGDEFNKIEKGHDYGWPTVTWGFDYSSSLAGPLQTDAGTDQPMLVWTPSISPGQIAWYSGSKYPFWNNSFFVGELTQKGLERIRFNEQGKLLLRERMLLDLNERIREVSVGPDGLIYLLTDHSTGRVLRLVPGVPTGAQLARVAMKVTIPSVGGGMGVKLGDPARGEAAFKDKCAACHSVGTRVKGGDIGPDLEKAYGRQAGTLEGYAYSPSMAKQPQTWDLSSLESFLSNPQAYVPGTKMSAPGVENQAERLDIIGFLNQTAGLGGKSFGGPNTVGAEGQAAGATP